VNVIGITGPTGAGKTTALHALRALGVEILDADGVYHTLLRENKALQTALITAFGEEIADAAGTIDRKRLSQVVYPSRLEELNRITHPFVLAALEQRLTKARAADCSVAIDAIALLESGVGEWCDVIVSVLAPPEVRVRRIMLRDGIDEAYARRRVLAQKPDDFFRQNSDFVLENAQEDTPERFAARAEILFQTILRKDNRRDG